MVEEDRLGGGRAPSGPEVNSNLLLPEGFGELKGGVPVGEGDPPPEDSGFGIEGDGAADLDLVSEFSPGDDLDLDPELPGRDGDGAVDDGFDIEIFGVEVYNRRFSGFFGRTDGDGDSVVVEGEAADVGEVRPESLFRLFIFEDVVPTGAEVDSVEKGRVEIDPAGNFSEALEVEVPGDSPEFL